MIFNQGCHSFDEEKAVCTQARHGEVNFNSSNAELKAAWEWAKTTALGYVREGDPVGPWYEAALPGREAFCMRDVSHQAMGAAALGLDEFSKNMFFRFAENISEPKDWCSYWEINKNNLPAPVDYNNDNDFWYNLPANFDVMDACFRMFVRTGDSTYINDPVFQNFYEKTIFDFVERWDLSPSKIMQRKRSMNLDEEAGGINQKYYKNRGIPGYYEGADGNMLLGIDLLAAQYAAFNWYNYYLTDIAGKPSEMAARIMQVDSLINHVFWDDEKKSFRTIYYEDGSWEYSLGEKGQDFSHYLLHFKALDDEIKINSILENYSRNKMGLNIELSSHLPELFFHYGRPSDGIFMLKYLSDSTTPRREYPENPFALTAAFINGLMGLNINAPERFVSTFSGFEDAREWGLAEKVPVAGGCLDILHKGRHTSVLSNHTTDILYWQAFMEAGPEIWFVNDMESESAGDTLNWYGKNVIAWIIAIPPGETVSISALHD